MHGKGEAPAIRILEEAGEDVGRLEYRFVERGGTKDAARAAWAVRTRHRKKPCVRRREGRAGSHGAHARRRARIPAQAPAAFGRAASPAEFAGKRRTADRIQTRRDLPFGLPSPLPVFAQISLFNLGMLYINAGERGVIAVIRPEALRLSGAVAGDILSGGSRR